MTRIFEHVKAGHRLGRHINHDPRSLGFLYKAPAVPVTSVTWNRNIGFLDQGDVGSCTGNAMAGALGTDPVFAGLPSGHPALDEAEALQLYHEATVLDPYPGTYPPDDTGSDGVSVAQAAKNDGLLSGYTHCLDLDTALQALMAGPVITGINWYSSFDTPLADGTVSIGRSAYVRGGHEVLIRGVDAENSMLLLDNSWGTNWGLNGTFKFSYATFTRLLSEDGDVTVPLPGTAPAPVPVPVLYRTDGTLSLLQISVKKNIRVSTMLRLTVCQFRAFSAGMSAYLQRGNVTAPMPAGEVLCLAWPQYTIR